MTYSQILLPEFNQEMTSTRKMLERVPDGQFDWKPHPKSMALGRLASHVAELPSWATMTINTEKLELTPDFKPFSAGSTAELVSTLDKYAEEARTAIAGATDEALAVNWSLVFNGHTVMTMPRSAVLRSVVMNHLIHHRAQLSVYLRLLNVEIPGMYGPSADEGRFF